MSALHTSGQLVASADLAVARAAVLEARPGEPTHEANRRRILTFIDEHPDALHRTCLEGHLTGSAAGLLRAAGAVTGTVRGRR